MEQGYTNTGNDQLKDKLGQINQIISGINFLIYNLLILDREIIVSLRYVANQ